VTGGRGTFLAERFSFPRTPILSKDLSLAEGVSRVHTSRPGSLIGGPIPDQAAWALLRCNARKGISLWRERGETSGRGFAPRPLNDCRVRDAIILRRNPPPLHWSTKKRPHKERSPGQRVRGLGPRIRCSGRLWSSIQTIQSMKGLWRGRGSGGRRNFLQERSSSPQGLTVPCSGSPGCGGAGGC